MAPRWGFGTERRLRKRREFLAIQGKGRRWGGRHFLFFASRRSDPGTSSVAAGVRFGITVTRKVGNAVTRNRIKRIVREGCRTLADRFPVGLDVVVVARASATTATVNDAVAELNELARRLSSTTSVDRPSERSR